MFDLKHFTTIGDLAREIAQKYRFYDSAIRSLTDSLSMDAALKTLAELTVLEKSSIASIVSSLNEISKMSNISSSVRAMTDANSFIKSIFESKLSVETVMRSALEQKRLLEEIERPLSLSNQMSDLTISHRHMSAMLFASLSAQSKIMEIQSIPLGAAINASASFQQSLRLGLDKFTSSYNKLFDFINNRPTIIAKLTPVVTQLSPVEVFREADLLKKITILKDEQETSDSDEVSIVPKEHSLEDWLHKLEPGLVKILRGAREALISSNADRARHVATSIRELFTHVLHRLAPDENIRAWTTDALYYNNGRPTRRARLLYINKEINLEPFSEFVDADVNAVLTLIDALQLGTHDIRSQLTDRQLRALVDRMESLLLFLFRLNTTN